MTQFKVTHLVHTVELPACTFPRLETNHAYESIFCLVNGSTHDNLIGQLHNTIRHPGIPKETFKQLCFTIGWCLVFCVVGSRTRRGSQCYVT